MAFQRLYILEHTYFHPVCQNTLMMVYTKSAWDKKNPHCFTGEDGGDQDPTYTAGGIANCRHSGHEVTHFTIPLTIGILILNQWHTYSSKFRDVRGSMCYSQRDDCKILVK